MSRRSGRVGTGGEHQRHGHHRDYAELAHRVDLYHRASSPGGRVAHLRGDGTRYVPIAA